MNELTGKQLGEYHLEDELGRGSMGVVYRARHLALDREVAVKILSHHLSSDPALAARFIREAQLLATLNHPTIVQIYDAGQHDGVLYFVMEYVQGPTVGGLLRLDGWLPEHLAAEYAAQVADALDTTYAQFHVIHRDIKPENLMLDYRGRMKLLDFGLARMLGMQPITDIKSLVGSVPYASPEQIWGMPLDQRSDMYALGVVLYEMVTGQLPYAGRTLQALTAAVTTGDVLAPTTLNPDLSPALEQIILTALATDREKRFARSSLMAEALRALAVGVTRASTRSSPPEKNPSPSEQQRITQTSHPYVPLIRSVLTLPMRSPRLTQTALPAQNEELTG